MTRNCTILARLCALLIIAAAPSLRAAPPAAETGVPGESLAGEWLGSLAIGPTSLRLALHVQADPQGKLSATLDSLDQGALGIPVDGVRVDDREVELTLSSIGGSFRGTLNQDGSALAGDWKQGGNGIPLTFYRRAEPATLARPQDPVPPFPYEAREVVFRNDKAGIDLSGTLLIPEGEGPFPAVVFVSGSGPQDRDEALMGHRPFLVIADALARRGIASLRYDDRGFGKSQGDHMGSTVGEFADDAAAAVAFLSRQEEADTNAIGIVGHSEGGLIGPMAAQRGADIDFLVLLAPPGVPMDQLLVRQGQDIGRLSGVDESLLARLIEAQRAELELIKDPELNREQLKRALWQRWDAQRDSLTEAERQQLQLSDEQVKGNIELVATPWFRSLMRIDPAEPLSLITQPVLALFGEKDVQVAPGPNAEGARAALARAGNEDVAIETLTGLNHLFQSSHTGAIAEYGQIEETFSPAALERIADWIQERF